MTGPIAAVHAHPDDETLTSGALLAAAQAAGVPVTVVTCTRGERGEVIGSDPLQLEGDFEALGRYRESELANAMNALGGVQQVFLDTVQLEGKDPVRFVDSGMSWAGAHNAPGIVAVAELPEDVDPNAFYFSETDAAVERLVALLTQMGAQAVVTYEPGGGYGHPDHKRAYAIAEAAVARLRALGNDNIELFSAIVPAEYVRRARLELAQRAERGMLVGIESGAIVPGPHEPVASVAHHSPDAVWTVDVIPHIARVTSALAAHSTQVQWVDSFAPVALEDGVSLVGSYALSNNIVAPLFSHEFYMKTTPNQRR